MAQWIRGLAVLAAVCGLAAGGIALARGPDMNLPGIGSSSGSFEFSRPEPSHVNYEEDAPRRPAKARRSSVASFGYGKPVCVRLCDGFFFPTAAVTGGDAACAAQCPDAPTALYTMPGDKIEDAVSSTGAPYSKLPVAKRYQTSFEATCTCHRDTVAAAGRAKELLSDPTLRKGDVVMTANGFRVYQGDGYGPTDSADFVSLAKARVSKDERATLAAMEQASAGSRAPVAPDVVERRQKAKSKGSVTVDNGVASAAAPAQ